MGQNLAFPFVPLETVNIFLGPLGLHVALIVENVLLFNILFHKQLSTRAHGYGSDGDPKLRS